MAAFDTPFANELCTNYVPSLQERDHIRDLLVEPQDRLAQLDAKISELEQVLDTLKQERNVLDDEIQQHNHLLSPIRHLPDDMLREIFLACLPNTHNAVMDCKEAPLLLGLVCSRWRLLAYSTPSLWATLHIPYHLFPYGGRTQSAEVDKLFEAYDRRSEKHHAAVRDWLTRSGSCPLSISFLGPSDGAARPHDSISPSYLSIMLHFSQRWHSLELNIPHGPTSNLLASIPTTSIPTLTHLHLTFSSAMSTAEAEGWKTSGLLRAPRLRTLDISYVPFSPSHLSANSWSHLSSLHLIHNFNTRQSFATIQEAYNILSRCPRLTHCALDIFSGSDNQIPTDIISLPFLKTLCIIESCPSIATLFESFATLPKLRGISYGTRTHPSNERQFPLITLLTRANQVNYLSCDFNTCTMSDLSTMFALLPNLTHLINKKVDILTTRRTILPRNDTVEKMSLELLISLNNGELYCPRLQLVHLARIHNLSDATILSFIQSRMSASKSPTGNVAPLREFRTKILRAMEIDIRAELLDYIQDGTLTLDIVYQPRPIRHSPQFDPHNGLVVRAIPDIIRVCHSR